MRAAAATVVGIIVGGAIGFALRGWFVEDSSRNEEPAASRAEATDASATALPAPLRAQAEPLPLADASAEPAVPNGEPGVVAAADALVGILVYGAVLDPDGRPAKLDALRRMRFDSRQGGPRSVEVAKDSTYAIAGLKAGVCTLQTDFRGYRPTNHEIELSSAQPAVRLDIVLQPAVVLIVKAFTPSGESLMDALGTAMGAPAWGAGIAAIATRESPPALLPEIDFRNYERWDIGYFFGGLDMMFQDDALPKDAIGKLELDELLPAYVSLVFRHIVVQTQTVESGATEVVFVVPIERLAQLLGEVRVKVIDVETSQPIENATAELSDSQSGAAGKKADAAGVFTWDRQRPGPLELQISAPGHEQWDGVVSIPPGGVADLGTLELTPATSVKGLVLDQAGAPVSVGLRVLVDEARGLGMGGRRYNKSGADGRFECDGLGRRRYLVAVSDNEWTGLPVPVDLRQGNVEGVVVAVGPGTPVRFRTLWPAAESYGLSITTKDGLVISDTDESPGDWAWTKRLLPGDYIAILLREGRELKRTAFKVGAEDVAVDLSP